MLTALKTEIGKRGKSGRKGSVRNEMKGPLNRLGEEGDCAETPHRLLFSRQPLASSASNPQKCIPLKPRRTWEVLQGGNQSRLGHLGFQI